jgi:hypothetical protein
MSRQRWFVVAGLYVMVCLAVDFFPRHGPPNFRYTGSDPAHSIWNLGWPMPLMIYDPRNEIHVGPLGYPIFMAEALVTIIAAVIVRFVSRFK